VIERDYQLKIAMGFPPEHFRRVAGLLRFDPSRVKGNASPSNLLVQKPAPAREILPNAAVS
jgi:hypothetical protein